jgi:oligopeptidase B
MVLALPRLLPPLPLLRRCAPLALALLAACTQPEARRPTPPEAAVPTPPVAEQRAHEVTGAGRRRVDEYYWLRDDARTRPDVIAYLEAENAYAKAMLEPTEALQETLFAELSSRVKEDEASVPYRKGDWWYYTRYVPGGEHPVYARRRGSPDGPEQVMLDVNVMAEDHDYFVVGGLAASRDGRLLAWADDAVGREEYTLRVKDLATGQVLGDVIEDISGDLAWANDGRTLFYVRRQEGTLIPHQVWRHRLGSPPDSDVLVYEEPDPTYFVAVEKSRDQRHLLIGSFSTLTTEYRVLDADRRAQTSYRYRYAGSVVGCDGSQCRVG